MNAKLREKLKTLPARPGVYFHKSKTGEVIYVGKAAVLKNRVRQYFQSNKSFDNKTLALVNEIEDTDWTETDSEIDALFLESEMIKRYMPRYNILLRDDKSQIFVRIDMRSEWPHISFTRGPLDDGAEYYGPYYSAFAVKKALRYLRRIFPYYTRSYTERPDNLDVHMGLSPSLNITSAEYKHSLRKLIQYINGGRKTITRELEKEMNLAARDERFEDAASLRNKLTHLKELQRRICFGDQEFMSISKDQALTDIKELLSLNERPRRIECYDISHMSGTNVVASMVVFINGVSDRASYRKFKMRIDQNNDFYNMNEAISRRLSEKNLKQWGKPDLIIIDGGKGQLDAALEARDTLKQSIPMIGIAKKQEQIVIKNLDSQNGKNSVLNEGYVKKLDGYYASTDTFTLVNLPHASHAIKLLQRLRDESHRFAVSYHTVLKRGASKSSALDEVPGVGPATRKKLLKEFGSIRGIAQASQGDIAKLVGNKKAVLIKKVV